MKDNYIIVLQSHLDRFAWSVGVVRYNPICRILIVTFTSLLPAKKGEPLGEIIGNELMTSLN